uniref:hypothetical protein n=1 Tax=Escherichia coli TaxID=562 RepID=UPI001968A09D
NKKRGAKKCVPALTKISTYLNLPFFLPLKIFLNFSQLGTMALTPSSYSDIAFRPKGKRKPMG